MTGTGEPCDDAGPTRAARERREVWEREAGWWRDTFTGGADPEYEGEILPLVEAELAGSVRVLDLGCGEGQVARRLLSGREPSRSVVGVDPSAAQLAHALEARGPGEREGGRFPLVRGEAERLPFADGCFDAVVCSLVIEHAEDVDAVLAEVARVLAPGGVFLLLVNHPLYQGPGSGFVDDQILGERYWRVGPYLVEGVSWEDVDAGVRIPFAHRPLSRYVNPLAARDLLLTRMLEPAPLAEFLASSVDPELEGAIPRLLAMRFEHRPARSSWEDRAGEGGGAWRST
ncbi:MAG: class I SAM-dependent methyltransferase [Actinomycetota bacterium]|nr:class I SAM-dependent methyltransferase [Actinomycetota bacterium]